MLEALGVIARLTENKALSVRTGDVDIDDGSKMQFLFRWWGGDSRKICLEKVKQIFNEAIHMARAALQEIILSSNNTDDVARFLEKERSVRRFGRLTEGLEAASHGIETHKVTYKNDDRFCSLVEVLVSSVRDNLKDMDMTLQMRSVQFTPQPVSSGQQTTNITHSAVII